MMNRYANLTLVGLLLALVGCALAAPMDVAETCKLTETKPTINSSKLEAINSEDSKFLAKMGAYMEFNEDAMPIEDGKKYLELNLKEVTFYNTTYQQRDGKLYIFKMDCASLILLTHPDWFAEDFAPMSVNVDESINNIVCQVDCKYEFPLGHNKCAPQAFPCYSTKNTSLALATINFVGVEYEVSMDLDSHKNKKFAQPLSYEC